jgi:hypothetical protein
VLKGTSTVKAITLRSLSLPEEAKVNFKSLVEEKASQAVASACQSSIKTLLNFLLDSGSDESTSAKLVVDINLKAGEVVCQPAFTEVAISLQKILDDIINE